MRVLETCNDKQMYEVLFINQTLTLNIYINKNYHPALNTILQSPYLVTTCVTNCTTIAPINVFCRSKPEAYSELCQTSKMELFTKIVNGFQPLIILQTALSQIFVQNRVLNTPQNRRIHNSHGSRVDFKCALPIRSIVLSFLRKFFN